MKAKYDLNSASGEGLRNMAFNSCLLNGNLLKHMIAVRGYCSQVEWLRTSYYAKLETSLDSIIEYTEVT